MTDNMVDALITTYMKYETRKKQKKLKQQYKEKILPNYVIKRRIKIFNNGEIVFDSKDFKEIPEGIQYAIKSYGIPKKITPNNKTPLVYRINTTLSSMFPTEENENECINFLHPNQSQR